MSLSSLNFIDYEFGTRNSLSPQDVVTVHQIHSARVIANRGAARQLEDADALIENTPGVAVGVKTADCVPVLLADPVKRAVAAIHAGWRGTAAAIVPAAIRAMAAEFGTRPEDLHAAIGPCIRACCYEVGAEVAKEFGIVTPNRVNLDLTHLNRSQLSAMGVEPSHISIEGGCTRCHAAEYHSYRRDGQTAGRMISWIRIRR